MVIFGIMVLKYWAGQNVCYGFPITWYRNLNKLFGRPRTCICTQGRGLPRWLSGKESACRAGDVGLIPGSRISPGERNRNPLQYACLESPMHTGAWRATVHGAQRVKHSWATPGGWWGAVQRFLALSSYSSSPECLWCRRHRGPVCGECSVCHRTHRFTEEPVQLWHTSVPKGEACSQRPDPKLLPRPSHARSQVRPPARWQRNYSFN